MFLTRWHVTNALNVGIYLNEILLLKIYNMKAILKCMKEFGLRDFAPYFG